MMKKLFFLPLLALLLTVTGCIPAELQFHPLPENPADPVVIAALLPLTGTNKIYAEQMKEGLQAAETVVNQRQRGISGRRLQMAFFDTKGTAEGTAQALQDARSQGAIAVVAGYDTGEVAMITAQADRLQMPMIIPLATSDYHSGSSPFVYRNCFSDTQQMEVLASFLAFWRQKNTGAIVTDPAGDDEYTRGISRNFTQSVTDLGGSITCNMVLQNGQLLTEGQLRSLLMTEPQFILISARGQRAAQLVRQLREAGFYGILCGPDSWDDDEFTNALNGTDPGECVFTAFFNPQNNSQEYTTFRQEFRRRFYHYPGACETQSYDALIFLAIALNNTDNLWDFDRNWRQIINFQGAAATYTMLRNGGLDRTVYLKSFGVDRSSGTPRPIPRLTKELQYSKLRDYQVIE